MLPYTLQSKSPVSSQVNSNIFTIFQQLKTVDWLYKKIELQDDKNYYYSTKTQ